MDKDEKTDVVTEDLKEPKAQPTPNLEQQLETLRAELKAEQENSKKANESIKGLKGSLLEKDKQLKEQKTLREEINTLKESHKILATLLAEKENISDEVPENKKSEYLKKFDDLYDKKEKEAKQKEAIEKLTETLRDMQSRTEALGLTEEDEEYWDIYSLARTGDPINIKKAELKLKKLEKEKQVKSAEPQKEEKEDKDKEIADLKAELKKLKGGSLESEVPRPAGQTKSFEEIEKDYIAGNVSLKDYEEARRKKGL